MVGNGIFFSGLASGLDTRAIIDQLVALERIPIQQIELQKDTAKSKLSLVGTFKGLVTDLRSSANSLRTTDSLYSFSVGMSIDGIATISASSGAVAGTHTLEVSRTASLDRWAFDGIADDELDLATVDGQAIAFEVDGTTYTATLTAAESNIFEIAAAINEVASDVVSASVVNAGTDADPSFQLVLAAKQSGEDSRITDIRNTVAGLSIDTTGPNGNGVAQSENNISVGLNAIALIDGLQVERTDNDFSNVIEGVSIDLLSSNVGEEMTFTVEADRAAIRGRIDSFIDAYNKVIDFVNEQNSYSEESGAGGVLFGDPILRRVRSDIQTALFNADPDVVDEDAEGYSSLSLVGIKQDSDGRLSVDETLLDEKMNEDLASFADLFADTDGFERASEEPNTNGYYEDASEDGGVADDLWRIIDRMLRTQEGPIVDDDTGERLVLESLFGGRETALKKSVERFDDQIEAKERRMDSFEENLVRRFTALEKIMGELNARGAALSNALLGLSSNFNR